MLLSEEFKRVNTSLFANFLYYVRDLLFNFKVVYPLSGHCYALKQVFHEVFSFVVKKNVKGVKVVRNINL